MEEILKKASELGFMLKSTEASRHFEEATRRVEEDEEAHTLLQQYNRVAEAIQVKQMNNDIVENYELENFREITGRILSIPLLKEYISARDEYMKLLMEIHEALSGDAGV